MTQSRRSVDRRKTAAEKSVCPMLAFRLSALVLFAAAAFSTQGTVLVYEGFHEGDWTGITATGSQRLQNGKTTGNYTTGFDVNSNWSVSDSTTQLSVSGTDYGLALPAVMTAKGFKTCGGAVQTNPTAEKNELRGGVHAFTANTLKVSRGKLYVRALLRLTEKAATRLNSVATPAGNSNGSYCGLGLVGSTSANRYPLTQTGYKSSCSFLMWKDSNASGQRVLSLCLVDANGSLTHYPLVTGFNLESTYLCYAEINVGVGTDGEELIRAGAIDTADYEGAAPWASLGGSSETVEVQLITDSYYPKAMAFAGPYGTKNGSEGSFRADELVVGTELGDILPAGGIFAVSQSGAPTIGTDSFSTDWILVADQGVTATAGFVLSTDETFATATTNSLGTGLAADTRTATLTDLEPDTTYWWKIYADNGTETVETPVGSFKTAGAPILGTATATLTDDSATFSVALSEAAMQNTLTTSVLVFYGTNGVDWTEFPIGSSTTTTNLSGAVESLGYGVTYRWFARATATMEGGRVLSSGTATNSFITPWNSDMYVNAASTTAAKPYKTPETAAKTISAAISAATDGATIHVAPGLYAISSPLEVRAGIRILGDNPDPSRTIVSNTTGTSNANQYKRVFTINHADAVVANLTMQKGEGYGSYHGGNFYIGSAGGIVSNCVVESGYCRDNAVAAGAKLDAGIVTHTVFRKNRSGSGSANWSGNRPGVLELNGSSRIENCLFVANNQTVAVTMMNLNGSSVMRNCTIVDSSLAVTNAYCPSWSVLNIASGVTVQNVVIAGVTNIVDGEKCKPTGTRANFVNGALDSSIDGTKFPATTIVGTAAQFFNDYANGDYTLNPTSLLVSAGADYEEMASVDLAGKKRYVGRRIDIGCYECQGGKGFLLIVR